MTRIYRAPRGDTYESFADYVFATGLGLAFAFML